MPLALAAAVACSPEGGEDQNPTSRRLAPMLYKEQEARQKIDAVVSLDNIVEKAVDQLSPKNKKFGDVLRFGYVHSAEMVRKIEKSTKRANEDANKVFAKNFPQATESISAPKFHKMITACRALATQAASEIAKEFEMLLDNGGYMKKIAEGLTSLASDLLDYGFPQGFTFKERQAFTKSLMRCEMSESDAKMNFILGSAFITHHKYLHEALHSGKSVTFNPEREFSTLKKIIDTAPAKISDVVKKLSGDAELKQARQLVRSFVTELLKNQSFLNLLDKVCKGKELHGIQFVLNRDKGEQLPIRKWLDKNNGSIFYRFITESADGMRPRMIQVMAEIIYAASSGKLKEILGFEKAFMTQLSEPDGMFIAYPKQ